MLPISEKTEKMTLQTIRKRLILLAAALPLVITSQADEAKTIAHWSFNYGYAVKDGVGTPNSTQITSNGNVNLHGVRLLPNETLGTEKQYLTAVRPTRGANDVESQDDKGAYQEIQAINCDGAALHMTSPAPTPETASNTYQWGDKAMTFPGGMEYSYQHPFNYFEMEVNTKDYKDIQLIVKAAGHNSQSQYYAVAWSLDGQAWTVVNDDYLTGSSYNRWETVTVDLPAINTQEKAFIRLFPAKNWMGGGASVNGNNQFDLDDVFLMGALNGNEAKISSITIDGQTVNKGEDKYDFECRLPKTYTDKQTTINIASEYAKVAIYAEEEDSGDEVEVTNNGNGSYTFDTPVPNSATLLTMTLTADDNAIILKKRYTMRLFHAGELQLRSLFVDGDAVDAAVRTAINSGDAYTATIQGKVFTKMPTVKATANDGTTPKVTAVLNGHTAVYTIQGDDRTFTLNIEGVYIYQKGDKDEEYMMTYNPAGKEAYEATGSWTDGWTDGLYTLRTTSLDGWNKAQFKFNAADNLLEVPSGVVVKTLSFERFGANYGDGEGLTAITSEGATFRIPTKHGYSRGGRDTLTVMIENHKPGDPIAFTLTGGNQPYAQIRLVIEKTNPGTAPKVIKKTASVSRKHAMVTVSFDREMSPCNVMFEGREFVSGSGAMLTFGIDGLDYSKQYQFTIPAGAATDLFGNKTAEAITIDIQTEAQAPVEKKVFDYVVGTAEEFTAAIKAIGNSNKTDLERITIFLKDGDYDFGKNNEQRLNRGYVSLIGQSRNGVTIRGVRDGISNPILNLRDREGFYLQDMTLQNDHDFGRNEGVIQAVAVYGGNKTIMKNIRMHGNQDTQVTGERAYFDKCEIHGMVDFICGGGNNFYDQCDLVIENRAGCVIAAPNNSPEWGYVFSGCTIKAADNAPLATNGSYYLGRPWQPVPRIYYINTKMELLPANAGWTSMGTMETHFYEYGSTDKDGNLLDLSVRRNSPTSTNTYTPVISAEEAKRFTVINVLGGSDGWLPTDYTQLTSAPKAKINDDGLITWDDDDQARCYVIFKDDVYVTNTTDTFYQATEKGVYSIRSANEMGGLSTEESRVAYGVVDGIQTATINGNASEKIYNLSGQQVNSHFKGVVIKNGRAILQK